MKQLVVNQNLAHLLGQHLTQFGWHLPDKRPL